AAGPKGAYVWCVCVGKCGYDMFGRGVVEAGTEREEARANGCDVGFRRGDGGVFFVVVVFVVVVILGVRRGSVRAIVVVPPKITYPVAVERPLRLLVLVVGSVVCLLLIAL